MYGRLVCFCQRNDGPKSAGMAKISIAFNNYPVRNMRVAVTLLQASCLAVFQPISGCVCVACSRADFHFFHRRGGKILGGVQVICNMPFLMLWKGH